MSPDYRVSLVHRSVSALPGITQLKHKRKPLTRVEKRNVSMKAWAPTLWDELSSMVRFPLATGNSQGPNVFRAWDPNCISAIGPISHL